MSQTSEVKAGSADTGTPADTITNSTGGSASGACGAQAVPDPVVDDQRSGSSRRGTGQVSGNRSPAASRSVPGDPRGAGPTSSALRQLAHDLGDDSGIVHHFVADYLSLLDSRLERLAQLLAAGEVDAAVVSILSLETTSAMIGAPAVVTAARDMREALLDDQHDADVTGAFTELQLQVSHTRASLTELGFTAVQQ